MDAKTTAEAAVSSRTGKFITKQPFSCSDAEHFKL